MPTTSASRRRLASVLVLLSLTPSLPAADFQGADAVLRRLSASSETPSAISADGKVTQLKAQLAAYRQEALMLAPEVAATRWLSLFDGLLRLPEDETSRLPYGERIEVATLLSVLPPPDSWDALAAAIESRTAKTSAPRELSLRILGAILAGDSTAQNATVERLRAVVKADKKLEDYQLDQLIENIDRVSDAIAASGSDSARLAAFERELAKYEDTGSARSQYRSNSITLPDLIRFGGRDAAEPLLLRALRLDVELQLWSAGDHTRRALSEIALKHIGQIKRPQWALVTSLDDVALYEAMAGKFPAKGASTDDERRSATLVYLLGLVASERTADATALVFAPETRLGRDGLSFGHSYGNGADVLGQLQRAGRGDAVVDFLSSVLTRDPSLPLWDGFISISAQQSRAKEALDLLRTVLAKPDLPAAEVATLRTRYVSALLAADEVDEGLSVLRALVAEDRRAAASITAKAPINPDATVVTSTPALDSDASEARDETGNRVARVVHQLRLSRLLAKPELVDEGMAAGGDLIPRFGKNDLYLGETLVEAMAETLEKSHRADEAETFWVEHLVRVLRDETHGGDRSQTQSVLLKLAGLYGRAGRHADVLRLLSGSPDLDAADLDEISMDSCSGTEVSPHLLIADALIASNRADEARRILRRIVQNRPGCDAAYERLEKLGGADYAALLDAAARIDRFEERPLIWKARLQLAAGDVAAAEQSARAAIAIDPSDGEQGKGDRLRAYAVLGDVLERKGDALQAALVRGAVAAIRLSEEADDWWTAGLLTRAVGLYEKSLFKFADAYCIQSRLALRYSELGISAKAEEHYRRAFELMPESFGRVESHCFGCEGAFNGPRAQNIADKVFTRLAAEPYPRAQVFYLLGYLRSSQARFDEATVAFRQAVAQDPDYLNAWEKLQDLAGSVHLPEAEREAASLALLRLDPEGKHTSIRFDGIPNPRKLWGALLAAEASIPPREKGPLFEFSAAKAKREADSKKSAELSHYRRFAPSGEADLRSRLREHDLLSATAQLIAQTARR